MKKAIIVDLDGTFCNIDHRLKYIDGSLGKKDWEKFYSGMNIDTQNRWCVEIVQAFLNQVFVNDYVEPLFVTGRPDKYTQNTQSWIQNIFNPAYGPDQYTLYMRKQDDYRPDYIIKKEIYEKHIKDEYDVLFALEDRKQVVDMWREQGITCLQCADGDF